MAKLGGKTAIVTGSGRRIGRAIALELVQEGVNVAVVDLVGEKAERVAEEKRPAEANGR
jgi:short chain dehydrogenase.